MRILKSISPVSASLLRRLGRCVQPCYIRSISSTPVILSELWEVGAKVPVNYIKGKQGIVIS